MLPGGPTPVDSPPRRSWLRRRGPAIVAALLVVVVGIGLWWFVLVTKTNEANDTELGSKCDGPSVAETFRTYTNFSMVPDEPGLAEARDAFRRLTRSPRWRIDVTADATSSDPVRVVMVRDADTVEFRRDGGNRSRLTPDGSLVAAPGDSSFWVATCHDPSFTLFATGRAGCIERRVSGRDVVFTYRGAGSKGADCTATTNTIDSEVVLRDGKFVSWSFELTTESGVSRDEWKVATPEALDEPWPWQVVPEWFVNAVG